MTLRTAYHNNKPHDASVIAEGMRSSEKITCGDRRIVLGNELKVPIIGGKVTSLQVKNTLALEYIVIVLTL